MTQGMEHLPLQGQAERAEAVHPGEEKAPGRPERHLSVSRGGCKKEGYRLLSHVYCDRMRGNGFKKRRDLDSLGRRFFFFTLRVVRNRNRASTTFLDILETFKVSLDWTLSDLI